MDPDACAEGGWGKASERGLLTLRKLLSHIAVCGVLLNWASAFAQSPPKVEVFGSIGMSWYDAPSKRFNWGVGIGVRPFWPNPSLLRGIGFEFEGNRSSQKDRFLDRQLIGSVNVLYHFQVRRTEPYFL